MIKVKYKKQTAFIIFAIAAILIIWGSVYPPVTFKDLRTVKQEAWKQCEWNTWGIPVDHEDAFENIDGAVREGGEVYMSITDWTDKGISKGGDIPVFSSKTSDIVIGTLKENTIVTVLEHEADRTLIRSGYVSGYIKSSRLLYAEQARKQADKVCPERVLTDMTGIKVYKTAETGEIQCYLQQRYSYDIIAKIPEWYQISMEYYGENYVKSSDVKIVRKTWLARLNSEDDVAEAYREIELSEADRELWRHLRGVRQEANLLTDRQQLYLPCLTG